jgi:hypothetical protein
VTDIAWVTDSDDDPFALAIPESPGDVRKRLAHAGDPAVTRHAPGTIVRFFVQRSVNKGPQPRAITATLIVTQDFVHLK